MLNLFYPTPCAEGLWLARLQFIATVYLTTNTLSQYIHQLSGTSGGQPSSKATELISRALSPAVACLPYQAEASSWGGGMRLAAWH
jgi:hypothetical protein